MNKFCLFAVLSLLAANVSASWYWPFGSDEEEENEPPRLSELMEPASELIEEATDLAVDGKVSESIEKYRSALKELERIEAENPDRAKSPEFATLRNKRAYVNATIDTMLLNQIRSNAKAVAVSDTRGLEQRLADEKAGKQPEAEKKDESEAVKAEPPGENPKPKTEAALAPAPKAKPVAKKPNKPLTRREQAVADIAKGDYAAANIVIKEMLEEKPGNALALNLKAIMEVRQGDFKAAERTLDQAIMSNPRDYNAYYNMAMMLLQKPENNVSGARRYYETGRAVGGPKDPALEAAIK